MTSRVLTFEERMLTFDEDLEALTVKVFAYRGLGNYSHDAHGKRIPFIPTEENVRMFLDEREGYPNFPGTAKGWEDVHENIKHREEYARALVAVFMLRGATGEGVTP